MHRRVLEIIKYQVIEMKVEFVNEIPKGFTCIKGMREPLYGDDNEIIGYREAGNSQIEPLIVVVKGKEKQLKEYHKQEYEFVQDWLVVELSVRLRTIDSQRFIMESELKKLNVYIDEAKILIEQLKATVGKG